MLKKGVKPFNCLRMILSETLLIFNQKEVRGDRAPYGLFRDRCENEKGHRVFGRDCRFIERRDGGEGARILRASPTLARGYFQRSSAFSQDLSLEIS